MSERDDRLATPGEAEFAARAAARLRDSADTLDAQTRSKLNRARQAALEQMTSRPAWQRSHWLTGAVTAAVAVVALVMWSPIDDVAPPPDPLALDAPDLELLMTDESLDMLEDLEFYTWLASTELDNGATG